MDFILAPADPEGQRALPDNPGACPQCGACAWRRNGTYARDLVVLGRLQVQCWQCKACLGSASPLPPGVTARQRPQAFRELVTAMYVHSVSFRVLVRLLDLLGCGVGAATLWRDVQAVAPGRAPDPQAKLTWWVEVDETWLSIGGVKRPVAVVLGPKGARLDLRLSGPGFDWGGWFTDLAARGVQGLTTDDDPVYGPALETAGLDRQQCAVHMQCTVGRHIRGIDDDDLTHLDRVLLPILRRLARERPPEAGPVLLGLWEAMMQGRVRPRAPAARGAEAALAPRGTLARAGAQPGEPQGARHHQPVGGLVGCPLGALQAPGPPDTGTEDRGGGPQLRAPDGPHHGLKRRPQPTGTEDRPLTAHHQYQRD